MSMRMLAGGLGLFLVLAVLHLGMRLHVLEHRIDVLEHGSGTPASPTRQATRATGTPPTAGKTVPVTNADYIEGAESFRNAPGRSAVGVPWEIDRGMMMDARQRNSQMPLMEETTIELGSGTISGGVLDLVPDSSTMKMPPEILQNLPAPR